MKVEGIEDLKKSLSISYTVLHITGANFVLDAFFPFFPS